MEQDNQIVGRVTVGMDLGDRHSHFCVLDAAGEPMEEGRVVTSRTALQARFGSCAPARIAIEAGTHSPWVSRLLAACGHDVLVANPRELRLIYKNNTKSDRLDAERLARVARMDPKLLSPIQHRKEETQADLAMLRARDALVSARTQLVNHVRGAVKSIGGRLLKCSTAAFPGKAAKDIPVQSQAALSPLLETITVLTERIRQYDTQIGALAETRYPQTQLLKQVAGVGALTSVAYVLTIEDPRRFKKSRAVGSYLGLRPRQKDSGDGEPQLRITKAGDVFLRRLMVGSAQYILGRFGPDTDLRRWGLKLAERGGKNAKKRAVVAVARRLAVLLHRLWTTSEVYEPLRQANRKTNVKTAMKVAATLN
jgi:transposase